MKKWKKLLSVALVIAMMPIMSVSAASGNDYLKQRIYGASRYETAIEVAKIKQASGMSNIVVASGQNYPDALSGSYLAKVKNAAILLVGTDTASEAKVKAYIDSALPSGGKVYLLGGTGVITDRFEKSLGDKAVRVAGKGRYETNLAVLKEAGVTSSNKLIVCSGNGFADALSAAGVGEPILLVGDSLTAEQKAFIQSMNPSRSYVIGGPSVVKESIKTELNARRLYGLSRYDTSAAIAQEFFPGAKTAVAAFGQDYPDGLAGSVIAFMHNAPILLLSSGNAKAASVFRENAGLENIIAIGGPSLVTEGAIGGVWGIAEIQKPADGSWTTETFAQEFFKLLNEERAKLGRRQLKYAYELQPAIDIRANELWTKFEHERPNGKDHTTAYDSIGYYGLAGECITGPVYSPQDAFTQFKNSEAHWNMLTGKAFDEINAGQNGWYEDSYLAVGFSKNENTGSVMVAVSIGSQVAPLNPNDAVAMKYYTSDAPLPKITQPTCWDGNPGYYPKHPDMPDHVHEVYVVRTGETILDPISNETVTVTGRCACGLMFVDAPRTETNPAGGHWTRFVDASGNITDPAGSTKIVGGGSAGTHKHEYIAVTDGETYLDPELNEMVTVVSKCSCGSVLVTTENGKTYKRNPKG